jgi:hypothetical protein
MNVPLIVAGRRQFGRLAALSLLLPSVMAGCGPSGPTLIPVRGEVVYNGAPLKQGTVVYLPTEAGDSRQASGGIQPDGSFVLTTIKNGDGVAPGKYNIVIYSYAPQAGAVPTRADMEAAAAAGKEINEVLIPDKYSDPTMSGLSDTVDSDHPGTKRIELAD